MPNSYWTTIEMHPRSLKKDKTNLGADGTSAFVTISTAKPPNKVEISDYKIAPSILNQGVDAILGLSVICQLPPLVTKRAQPPRSLPLQPLSTLHLTLSTGSAEDITDSPLETKKTSRNLKTAQEKPKGKSKENRHQARNKSFIQESTDGSSHSLRQRPFREGDLVSTRHHPKWAYHQLKIMKITGEEAVIQSRTYPWMKPATIRLDGLAFWSNSSS